MYLIVSTEETIANYRDNLKEDGLRSELEMAVRFKAIIVKAKEEEIQKLKNMIHP